MICNNCPRNCYIGGGQTGFCNAPKLKVSMVMRHMWEEPIISGENGSGCIFFSSCNLKCCFCQNSEISFTSTGKEITVNELVDIFKLLEKSNVHNINLVSPTHFSDKIIKALKIYKPSIPIVWNSNGYENSETIKQLKDLVDVYLVDFKYFDNKLATKYSNANNYFEKASTTIVQMRQNQQHDIIENGLMKKGLIIRHLILPNHTEDSKKILDYIASNIGSSTYISLMSQYMPLFNAKDHEEINRKLKPIEYKIVLNHLQKLGFINGFSQAPSSADKEFIPPFVQNNEITYKL